MMHTKKMVKFLFSIALIALGFLVIVSNPHLMMFGIGGVITGGILGGFSGKVGAVVGGKWKGIWYMRGWVKPANPNSPDQQTQRGKMSAMVLYARGILTGILQPFWDPFYNEMSGYNAFVSENIGKLDVDNKLPVGLVVAKGNLEGLASITATYDTATGSVVITWDKDVFANGLVTDSIGFVVNNTTDKLLSSFTPVVTRNAETATLQGKTGLTAANVIAYAFAYRSVDDVLEVSPSIGDVCAAP